MNGALKSIIYSHMNWLLSHEWILNKRGVERRIVHNLFLYMSNANKHKKKKNTEKFEKNFKKGRKKKVQRERRPCRKELTLTGCNVHMCIYVQLTVIFWGEQTSRGSINYIFIHRIVN